MQVADESERMKKNIKERTIRNKSQGENDYCHCIYIFGDRRKKVEKSPQAESARDERG